MTYQHAQSTRRPRRWLGPVIILSVLVILVVAAYFVAERLARDAAADLVSIPIKKALGSTQPVSVDFGSGSFLLQAASGRLDSVSVATDDVPLGPATGDVALHATGVPLDTEKSVSTLSATVSIDGAGVQALVPAALAGGSLAFAGDALVVTGSTTMFGQTAPVEVHLTPAVATGAVTFTVTSMTVGGQDVSVDEVRAGKYGPDAAALATAPSVCVAQYLPAALQLTTATIAGGHLVLEFSGANIALSGASFSTKGACA